MIVGGGSTVQWCNWSQVPTEAMNAEQDANDQEYIESLSRRGNGFEDYFMNPLLQISWLVPSSGHIRGIPITETPRKNNVICYDERPMAQFGACVAYWFWRGLGVQ